MNSSSEIVDAREFTNRLSALLRAERDATADFIGALIEFDALRLWEKLGYAGLFPFLHRELRMSEGAAFYRKTAVELAAAHPEVLTAIRDGKLCITVIPEVAKVLTTDNRDSVLPRFFHLSRKEARELVATLSPQPNPPDEDRITYVVALAAAPSREAAREVTCTATAPAPAAPGASHRARADLPLERVVDDAVSPPSVPASVSVDAGPASEPAPPAQESGARTATADATSEAPMTPRTSEHRWLPQAVDRDEVVPLTAEVARLHTNVTRRCVEMLDAARALLSHTHPRAKAGEILELALGVWLAETAKKRHAARAPRPRRASNEAMAVAGAAIPAARPAQESGSAEEPATAHVEASFAVHGGPRRRQHIPADVERAVRARDRNRCQWPIESGGICGETQRVQIDHVHPAARGGPPTVENLRLLCQAHNLVAARLAYGDDHMDRYAPRKTSASPTSTG